jgi:hypothetical protein
VGFIGRSKEIAGPRPPAEVGAAAQPVNAEYTMIHAGASASCTERSVWCIRCRVMYIPWPQKLTLHAPNRKQKSCHSPPVTALLATVKLVAKTKSTACGSARRSCAPGSRPWLARRATQHFPLSSSRQHVRRHALCSIHSAIGMSAYSI